MKVMSYTHGSFLTSVEKTKNKQKSRPSVCFFSLFSRLVSLHFGQHLRFGHPNIIEMSVPFERESVKEKDVDVNKIMRKLNMTQKQKQAVNLIMGGMNPYQVSKHLKVSNVAIYERVK